MIHNKRYGSIRIENGLLFEEIAVNIRKQLWTQRRPQPIANRDAKTFFGFVKEICWKTIFKRFLQDVLFIPAVKEELFRQLCREIPYFLVQERSAAFELGEHACAIDFHQHIAFEAKHSVDISKIGQCAVL